MDFIAGQLDNIPVFVTGDFNSWLTSPAITLAKQIMSVSCETAALNSSEVIGTYHAFGTTDLLIDFCLYKESLSEALGISRME